MTKWNTRILQPKKLSFVFNFVNSTKLNGNKESTASLLKELLIINHLLHPLEMEIYSFINIWRIVAKLCELEIRLIFLLSSPIGIAICEWVDKI